MKIEGRESERGKNFGPHLGKKKRNARVSGSGLKRAREIEMIIRSVMMGVDETMCPLPFSSP